MLFTGSVADGAAWVGLAKKLARQCLAAGVLNRVYRVADGVQIRIENVLPVLGGRLGTICKAWIEAVPSDGGYQFYTTSPDVQWAVLSSMNDFYPGGSVVYVPTPKLVLLDDGRVDEEKSVITARPMGSTVEAPSGTGVWPYVPTPPLVTGPLGLSAVMHAFFPVKNAWQVDGYAQEVYCETRENPKPAPALPRVETRFKLHQSWVQQPTQVYGANAFSVVQPHYISDRLYDAAPAAIKGRGDVATKVPDTDWYGRACTQRVGSKRYVVMSDAQGDWYCWPASSPLDFAEYAAEYGEYSDQAYKANVVPAYAKKVRPTYPSWVAPTLSWRDAYKADPKLYHFTMRPTLHFNSTGTRAIGVFFERRASGATFYRTDYTPSGLATAVANMMGVTPLAPPFMPQELPIDPLLIDASGYYGGTSSPKPLMEDRRGILEFGIQIQEIEGEVEFTVSILSQVEPGAMAAGDRGIVVDVGYAKPLDWSSATLAGLGPSVTAASYGIQTDDVLSVWLELYQHEENEAVIKGFGGEPSLFLPSKAKAVFYKGSSFDQELFRVAVAQSHGKGYSYTDAPHSFAPEPHAFCWNPNPTMGSQFPEVIKPEYADGLYYYTSVLEHLDITTLSFYYRTRLIEQKKDDAPFDAFEIAGFGRKRAKLMNRSKTLCRVCVMGRVVDEVSAGHPDLSDAWLRGWQYEAGSAPLDEDESLVAPDTLGGVVLGLATDNSITGTVEGYIGPNQWGHRSWINSGHVGPIWTQFHELGMLPWWLLGPCGHLTRLALSLGVMAGWFGGGSASYGGTTITYPSPGNLFEMTRADMGAFAVFIWNLHSMFHGTFDDGGGVVHVYSTDRYSMNPLASARLGMSSDDFAEEISGLLWLMVQDVKRVLPSVWPGPFVGFGVWEMQCLSLPVWRWSVQARGGGAIIGHEYNRMVDDDTAIRELYERQISIRDYETGTLRYNKAIRDYFGGLSMTAPGKILITPDGHISYANKGIFDIKVVYCSQAVMSSHSEFYFQDYAPTALELDQLPTASLTGSDIDWALVDGVSWYYGKIKTKNLWLYNLAYSGNAAKKFLKTQETYTELHDEASFRPDFRFTDLDSMQWMYPMEAENGRPENLCLWSMPRESSQQFKASVPHPVHEARPYRSDVRLSALFF